RLEHLAAKALEAARQIADAEAEDDARVPRAAAAHELPQQPPVAQAAAFDVARPEREVGALARRGEQPRKVRRVVREVRVHLYDVRRAGGQRVREARQIRRSEAL